MPIYVELGSYLRKFVSNYDPNQGIALDFRNGMTIADVLETMQLPDSFSAIVTVNRCLVGLNYQLVEGDRVGIFPTAWGG